MTRPQPATIAFYDAYATLDGSGAVLRMIVSRLDPARMRPVVIVPHDGALAEALRADGCPVVVLPPGPPLDSYGGAIMASGLLGRLRAARAVRRYAGRLASCLRAQGADLLHCNQTRALLQAGAGGVRAGVPVVWNVRIREPLGWLLARHAARCADHIIALTGDILDDVPGDERLRHITTVIPNAVDTARFSPDVDGARVRAELGLGPSDPLVLMVGVMDPRKAHDVLIRAAPMILQCIPAARIAVVGDVVEGGDPAWREQLRRLADE
ncbi:MAG TPA: glycosyltransferase, partial [Armatimonadota bacterium]|nr:glycosyltransferase [Armatimonadota bacterium]